MHLFSDYLVKNNKSELIFWVQKVLLEACNAKLAVMKKSNLQVEPVPFYSTCKEIFHKFMCK